MFEYPAYLSRQTKPLFRFNCCMNNRDLFVGPKVANLFSATRVPLPRVPVEEQEEYFTRVLEKNSIRKGEQESRLPRRTRRLSLRVLIDTDDVLLPGLRSFLGRKAPKEGGETLRCDIRRPKGKCMLLDCQ